MKKCITGLLLLAFAFPSWAEDEVWYCVEEHNYKLEDQNKDGVYELEHYNDEKFTLKHEANNNRLAIAGRAWGADELFYLDCVRCYSSPSYLVAYDSIFHFRLEQSRFSYTWNTGTETKMATGTCTKF